MIFIALQDRSNVAGQNLYHLRCDRSADRGRRGVVRLSAHAGEQIFLSRGSAFRGERGVAGGDDGEEHSSSAMTHAKKGDNTLETRRKGGNGGEKLSAD